MATNETPDSMLALVFGPKKPPSTARTVADAVKKAASTVAEKARDAVAAVADAQVLPLKGGGAVVVALGDPVAPALVIPAARRKRARAPVKSEEAAAKKSQTTGRK